MSLKEVVVIEPMSAQERSIEEMTVHISLKTPLIPLTAEAFGQDGDLVLRGTVEDLAIGPECSKHPCLLDIEGDSGDGNDRILYYHPTLFRRFYGQTNLSQAELTLKDGVIQLKEVFPPRVTADRDPLELQALPVVYSYTSVDSFVVFFKTMGRPGERCQYLDPSNGRCRERLEFRDAVCLRLRQDSIIVVICASCYEKVKANDPEVESRVVLDGRRVPFQSPVPVFAEGWPGW